MLKVDVVLLIESVFKRLGQEVFNVEELRQMVADDPAVWDIYAKGLTIGVNQCEKPATMEKLKRYKPRNVSELAAFIAAIRPGFKSMYQRFESREPFSYGIPTLDKLIQTKEIPNSYILFQENLMTILNYASFAMSETYQAVKDIAKKKADKVKALKGRFEKGFSAKLIKDENMTPEKAMEVSERIWEIIDDSSKYSFNSSHAYCMALDSLYCAYLKAHYPYEFYEVLLQFYSDKGNKDKVRLIKQEMRAFGIEEGRYRFGLDNRKFKADPEHHQIIPSLLSIKALSQKCANVMYQLGQEKFPDFLHLYRRAQKEGVNSKQLDILIKIGYFEDFGTQKQLDAMITAYEALGWGERQSVDLDKLPDWMQSIVRGYTDEKGNFISQGEDISELRQERDMALDQIVCDMKRLYKTKKASLELIKSNADLPEVHVYQETKMLYDTRINDAKKRASVGAKQTSLKCLLYLCSWIRDTGADYSTVEKIQREFKCLGYLATDYSKVNPDFVLVSKVDDKYATRKVTVYRVCDGEETLYKVFSRTWEELPLEKGDLVRLLDTRQDFKRMKDETGKWIPTKEKEWILSRYNKFQKKFSKGG